MLRASIIFILAYLLFSVTPAYSGDWHTSPDKWKEPRAFHGEHDKDFEDRIIISKEEIIPIDEEKKNYSPNKAYWFSLQLPDNPIGSGPWSSKIIVFNEREYLHEIKLIDYRALHHTRIEWINEKLLYVQFWFGRVLGTYFIYDVEEEKVIIKEMVWDGVIPFQQFRQLREKK